MSSWDAELDPDDERPVDAEAELVLPDHLDTPIDADEADAVDQAIEVPPDDEDE